MLTMVSERRAQHMQRITVGTCNIGKPLGNKVRAILGIAGANFGLCACVGHWLGVTWPTCNDDVSLQKMRS